MRRLWCLLVGHASVTTRPEPWFSAGYRHPRRRVVDTCDRCRAILHVAYEDLRL
jgi:hypothetical protein